MTVFATERCNHCVQIIVLCDKSCKASCGLPEDELERQPEAGHLFKIDLSADGIRGQPPSVFGKGIISEDDAATTTAHAPPPPAAEGGVIE